MSDKYCPAGKIECGNISKSHCVIEDCGDILGYRGYEYYKWEVCPWPSKQEPVDKMVPHVDESMFHDEAQILSRFLNNAIDAINEMRKDAN